MNRRRFLRVSGGGVALATLAGCLSSDDDPPPRDAEVFEDVSIADGVMEISLASAPTVESRAAVEETAAVSALLPVGVARAGSRSSSGSGSGVSGATGRGSGGYSSAPKDGRHGWAIYGGHSGGGWRDDHEDEITTYTAAIAALGVAYMGRNSEYQQDSPGPEPVPWDEEWSDPDPGTTLEADLAAVSSDAGTGSTASEGWYRVGTHLESQDGAVDFDWQAADFKLERGSTGGLTVDEAWHVRPRL